MPVEQKSVGKGGRQPGKNKWFADLLRFMAVGFIFLALAILIRQESGGDFQLLVQKYRLLLQGVSVGGVWSSRLLFILAAGLAISLGIPRLLVCGVAGSIYGSQLGTGLAMAGSLIGAAILYCLGRLFLWKVVERRLGGQLALWMTRFQENAFWWVLYGRLFPFSNSTMKSLLCGSCRVPFTPYLSASFLGFLPLTLAFTTFGSGGSSGDIRQVLLGFVLLLVALMSRFLINKRRSIKRRLS